jgi:hypothetical protein
VGALSGPGAADRRVLVVVTEGVESKESRHPVVTCIDAADSARVAIYALSPRPTGTKDEAGIARLRLLAKRTGGAFDGGGTPAAVNRVRDVVMNTQGLRMSAPPEPSTLVVRPGLAAARSGEGSLAVRRRVVVETPPNPALPGIIGGTVVLFAVVGAWVIRHRPIGRLVAVKGARAEPVLVTRSGVTLGGAQGNGLVLDHPKISRNHAVIRVRKGKVTLVDLRSSNGTRLNGRKIESAPLEHGDRILLADAVELRFERRFRFGRNG